MGNWNRDTEIDILKQLPGWSLQLKPGSDPIFINQNQKEFRLVHLSDPFGKHKPEFQMISTDCYPAWRKGLVKICL